MTKDIQKLCKMLYLIYGGSALLQFSQTTLLLGLFAIVIAYILTADKKTKTAATGTAYESHLRWMKRTFWIGSAVYLPLAVILSTVLILSFTDIASIMNTLNGDDPDAMMNGIQNYMTKNMPRITLFTLIPMVPTLAWWLKRCWSGYRLASAGKPVENVTTWL